MIHKNQKRMAWFALGLSLTLTNCSKKKSDASDDESIADSINNSIEYVNQLASAYPGGLAVSVFPQATAAGLRLQEEDEKGQTIKEKSKEAEAVLKGEGECLPPMFARTREGGNVLCYEFDQEMIYGTGATGQYMGTRDGTNGAGEACLVSFARAKVASVESMVDRALGLVQAMMCQAKKDGKSDAMPAAGEELNLADQLKGAMGLKVSKVTEAKIKRLADQNEHPVYRSDISVEMADGTVHELHLVHSPESTTSNDTYDGVLWTKRVSSTAAKLAPAPGQGPALPSNEFVSLQYAKIKNADGTYSSQSELLRGAFHDDLVAVAVNSDGTLNLNAGAKFEGSSNSPDYGKYFNPRTNEAFAQANDAVSGMMYIAFNMNPDDNSGTVSYFQNPGGNYQENARGMVFSLAKGDDGMLSGCGTSGATGSSPNNGFSIRQSKREAADGKVLKAGGFYHPFFNTENPPANCTPTEGTDATGDFWDKSCTNAKWYKPAGVNATLGNSFTTKQMGSIISRQCVKQDADGVYQIDTAETASAAGFDLIDAGTTEGAAKSVGAPVLDGLKSLVIE